MGDFKITLIIAAAGVGMPAISRSRYETVN